MSEPTYAIRDLGAERVVEVGGAEYRTYHSERVVRMLIVRKGPRRTPLYFSFKESRGRHFLERLFRTKVAELGLGKVRQVLRLTDRGTTRLPFATGSFDLALAIGVIEHLPFTGRHRYVNEYYRVLAPAEHIAILDTPNRAFPLETHSVGLSGIQWLPAPLAYRRARLCRPGRLRDTSFAVFDAGAWRNASRAECLPTAGALGLADVTEEAGYGWRFFRDTARSRIRRAVLPAFAAAASALQLAGQPPSRALPDFNVLFRKLDGAR